MIKVKNIKTGKVFDVIKITGEYWIDETGYIESEQLGITWELMDDYKQLYEQQKQRADELEKQNDILKHNIRVELDSSRNMYIGMCEQKQRADQLEKRWDMLKNFVEKREGISLMVGLTYLKFYVNKLEEDGE